jgi:hypothetical protein
MEQSPSWEANSSSASEEIPHILWNLKAHYCCLSRTFVPVLSQMTPVHALKCCFFQLHLTIKLLCNAYIFQVVFFLQFPPVKSYIHFSSVSHTYYIPCPPHSPWFVIIWVSGEVFNTKIFVKLLVTVYSRITTFL